ncbi:MAG: hypothetical protein CMK64_15135 [Pseudoalteromonas sp.]|nr:hypothetical protein [Pseudoalteromonas sp.]|tara:strand:+ start:1611 stop:1829 length:219 start_codon:yes stop_codon:yes gene_type:complete
MFRKWNPKFLFGGYDPVIRDGDLVDLKQKQRLHTKKQKKAKRRLTNKRKRARGTVSIGGNLGRFSKYQRELY